LLQFKVAHKDVQVVIEIVAHHIRGVALKSDVPAVRRYLRVPGIAVPAAGSKPIDAGQSDRPAVHIRDKDVGEHILVLSLVRPDRSLSSKRPPIGQFGVIEGASKWA